MNHLLTFFGRGKHDETLVGIGLTDEMIEHVKKVGMVLEPSELTKQNVDVVLVYAPTLNEVTKKVTDLVGKENTQVKFI